MQIYKYANIKVNQDIDKDIEKNTLYLLQKKIEQQTLPSWFRDFISEGIKIINVSHEKEININIYILLPKLCLYIIVYISEKKLNTYIVET